MVFVCPGIYLGIRYGICPAIYLVGKNIKKIHGLLEFVLGRPLGVGPDENSGRL